ncbi:speckle-type POZ protein [Diachasma alloeum]|uniref:speckle-type POZ protein n=1 Tax=Diachasma alloeum TaxID=454923 RepID=UPI0007384DCB|nr:speckle-type POZ protein [Diachasma alloeum]
MSSTESKIVLTQRTRTEVFTYHYEWKIKDFSGRPELPGQCIKSSVFSLDPKTDEKWYLRFYPKGTRPEEPNFTSLRMCLKSDDGREVHMKSEVSVLTVHQEKQYSTTWVHKYVSGRPFGPTRLFHKNWLTEHPEKCLPDDTLTLLCQFTVVESEGSSIYDKPKFNEVERRLGTDMGVLLMEEAKFSDITFDLSGEKIHAHRAVLAARSLVFETMFKYYEGVVPINDIEPEVFKAMMTYLYTDIVPKLKEMAGRLLEMAERFGLDSLKAMCEPVLFESLTTENCADILVKADLFRAAQLKSSAIEFITRNLRDVVKSPGYQILEKQHAGLLTQIILEMEPKSKKIKT